MAKQIGKDSKKFEFSKVGSILDNISKTIPIQIEKVIKEKTFISTGVYILDAALSARLLGGGIASNRITAFAGESGSGKSFLAYSVAKTAQKDGYSVIYIDTEQAVDLEDLPKFGIDTSLDKFRLLDELKNQKLSGLDIPKILIVLDSLGQMASNKEKADLLKGDIKQDMTKAKALGSMFRSINTDLGYLDIPMLVCNHTYLTLDLFPSEKLRGGNGLLYSASVIGFMSKSKLKDPANEDQMDLGQSGISVLFKTQKNRMAIPKKIRFDISFANGMNPYTGLDVFCTPENFSKIGIAQGKMDVDKKSGEMTFTPGGNRWYVSHLDKAVPTKQLFSPAVFTPEVMKKMEPIVNDYFRYKSVDQIEAIEKQFNDIVDENDEYGNTDLDDVDGSDLFS